MGGDVAQHFASFFDEDFEQFGVDFLIAGGEQLGCFNRRSGHRYRCFGAILFVLNGRFDHRLKRLRAGFGVGFCRGGLGAAWQVGQRNVGGRQFRCGVRRGGFCDGGFDLGGFVLEVAGQMMTLSASAAQAVDIEAQGRELVGEWLEQLGVRRLLRVEELGDHGFAIAQCVVGLLFVEQGEDGFDLLYRAADA